MTAIDYETKYQRNRAAELLADLRAAYEHAAKEIGEYEARLSAAETDADRAKVVGYAIHYASVNVNPRLDLLADVKADLAVLARVKAV